MIDLGVEKGLCKQVRLETRREEIPFESMESYLWSFSAVIFFGLVLTAIFFICLAEVVPSVPNFRRQRSPSTSSPKRVSLGPRKLLYFMIKNL